MNDKNIHIDVLFDTLKEREKELNCFYQIEELLSQTNLSFDELFQGIIEAIPTGWQYPDICQVEIIYNNRIYKAANYTEPVKELSAEIILQGEVVGKIIVSYFEGVPHTDEGYFLKEEKKLLHTIANRISQTILYRKLKSTTNEWENIKETFSHKDGNEWVVLVDMLLQSDRNLFVYLSRKMLHYLYWNGIEEANELLKQFEVKTSREEFEDINSPSKKKPIDNIIALSKEVFRVASQNFESSIILYNIQKWIQEDKSRFLVRAIDDPNSSLTEIIDAITRYHHITKEGFELSISINKGLRVSLIRRFFSDQLEFINIAKQYIDVEDYYDIVKNVIFPANSHGKLGGKSAGLFLASQIVNKCKSYSDLFYEMKVPKTWYITSDGLINFLYYNNLEEIIEQKYKDMDEIFIGYHNIIQMFKNSPFPPEIVQKLSAALDDIGEVPIIVRSSSLLEDRFGASFSGKYKSLFLANQGSKLQRLDALTDAIAEIYASTFGPDPIEYRKERGLIDFFEEMGVMIQEVVGTRVGKYFFPSFSGVAFSNNEFRWSPRIQREDGLIRIVPGLGTRAVDRLADDYPILISPGQPKLRVNITPDEIQRYSPKYIDAINMENNTFETIAISDLLKEYGDDFPIINHIVSLVKGDYVQEYTSVLNMDFEKDDFVVTFSGVINRTTFIKQIQNLLNVLKEKIKTPVDIEFAHDGKNLYLLQCRPQPYSKISKPAPIPRDIPDEKILFSAKKFISNGYIPNITHIVYVNPEAYQKTASLEELKNVGRAVSALNKILPKRQFILMGPGRWGSRGDIKLGVNVTYSDINNTAALIEIAKNTGNFTPDLSFGTHFFQDLVESSIRYLPLYPDEKDVVFNKRFFNMSPNILSELAHEFSGLSEIIRVIDVRRQTDGMVLNILMNADINEAIAVLANTDSVKTYVYENESETKKEQLDDFWRWRYHMAKKIADQLDPDRFGVKKIYIFGSTKNATAGPASDIDLLIHFNGSEKQKNDLLLWLEGWSLTLAEMNYLKTGYKSDGLLDIHIVTDEDIRKKTSYAVKIDAVTDAARELHIGKAI
ncbi:nucleotidyltransferase domain-containing protein [bacterium]|nr:nucleotidyltransferase domain-containing protein [bacterium]